MTIDGLAYIGESRYGYRLDPASLIEVLDHNNVASAFVAPTHRPDHDFTKGNAYVARAAEESGGRLLPMARVDPWSGDDAIGAVFEAIVSDKFRALLLHPAEEYFRINHPLVRRIAQRAEDLHLPVVVATGYPALSEAAQITQFAQWCPAAPVILTNGGQLNISGLGQADANLALELSNVYVQTSGVYRDDWIARVVSQFGAERIMFASSEPLMEFAYELKRIQLAHVTDEAKALILGGNSSRLFKLANT
jgi:uncharacterized protein